jgi:hypothetical protein
MVIDGLAWFVGAILVCGAHALFLISWRAESRDRQKQWAAYNEASQQRHDEFMVALREARVGHSIPRGTGEG